jgi:DNA-binding response OmpR family regulator
MIFMDVQMPVMDGLTCLRRLKADPTTSSTPVVMVFAPAKDVNGMVCLESGADAVLLKPIVRKDFLELGRRFLFHIDRREKRVPYQALVTLQRSGEKVHCTTENISVHGAYINSRRIPEQNERMRVIMVLPGAGAAVLECGGRVTWLNHGFPRPRLELPQGFGIEFEDVDEKMSRVLLDIVENAKSFPGG